MNASQNGALKLSLILHLKTILMKDTRREH